MGGCSFHFRKAQPLYHALNRRDYYGGPSLGEGPIMSKHQLTQLLSQLHVNDGQLSSPPVGGVLSAPVGFIYYPLRHS